MEIEQEKFDMTKSVMTAEQEESFLNCDFKGEIKQTPGIGPATEQKLNGKHVNNVRELFGLYLQLGADDFNTYLSTLSIGRRQTITHAMKAMAMELGIE